MLRSWEDLLAMSIFEKYSVGSLISECLEKVMARVCQYQLSMPFSSSLCLDYCVLWCQGLLLEIHTIFRAVLSWILLGCSVI